MWCRYSDQECAPFSTIGMMRALIEDDNLLAFTIDIITIVNKLLYPYHQTTMMQETVNSAKIN